jgi:Dolichyl-phosphate-mannose-protein mannosyltransferase
VEPPAFTANPRMGLDSCRALPKSREPLPAGPAAIADTGAQLTTRASRTAPWVYLFLLVVISGALLLRSRVLSTPLERDEGEYAYAGQLLLQGIPPYQLAYNMKLPGTYFAYAAGMALFGQTEQGIHLLLALANAATGLFVFLLGRELFGAVAGLCSAAIFAVASASPGVLGMAGHANHFVILFAVPGVWLLWRSLVSNRRWEIFASGLLLGVAFLMKQQAIFFLLFAALCFCVQRIRSLLSSFSVRPLTFDVERLKFALRTRPSLHGSFLDFVTDALLLAAGMLLPFVVTCICLDAAGVFPAFQFWVFQYAQHYLSVAGLSDGFEYLRRHLAATSTSGLGFRLLAIIGFGAAVRVRPMRKEILFLAFFAIASFGAVSLGLFFRPHYFILGLPALALLAGLGAVELGNMAVSKVTSNHSRLFRRLAAGSGGLAVIIALLVSFYAERQSFFASTPSEIVERNYPGNPFLESKIVGEFIRAHSTTTGTVAVIGSEPQIYFYSSRHSATGYLYTYPLMERQPFALKMRDDLIREVERGKPDFLVRVNYEDSWASFADSDRTIFKWCDKYTATNYSLVGYVARLPSGKLVQAWKLAEFSAIPRQNCLLVYAKN